MITKKTSVLFFHCSGLMLCACAMLMLVVLSGCVTSVADDNGKSKKDKNKYTAFEDDILSIDIKSNGSDWQTLLDNAQNKEWICADVVINGKLYESVGIRTKGNSSLMQQGSGSNRYSLQFNMKKYVKGQSYNGIEKFCVNNMMGDATYMKEYISYDIMNYVGVETPLKNYASIKINGEDYMFGIALERYDQPYLKRVNGSKDGHLYNVQNGMGGGMDRERDGFGGERGGMGGFGGRSSGGSLVYTNDEISSYSAIFENAEFNKTTEDDNQRVITALKNLNSGNDLEKYVDVDQTLRYFAAHTVVVNLDSYISSMQQNYYLYENDGKIIILPWDYNLAFGGFQSSNASSVVNFPIDTPVSGISMEERPLLNKLLEVDEYREKYHSYLNEIVEGYFESGLFEKTVKNLDKKISDYVKNDVSPFYSYEQYQESLTVFVELGRLRALSIRGQLDGTIPSTTNGQIADSSLLIDASGIDISKLGSMMGGGNRGGMGGMGGERGQFGNGGRPDFNGDGEMPNFDDGNMPDHGGFGSRDRSDFGSGGMSDFGDWGGGMPDFGGWGRMPDFGGWDNWGSMPNFGVEVEEEQDWI